MKMKLTNEIYNKALFLLISTIIFIGGSLSAYAATITVDTTVDENGTGATCSLREAVEAANTDAAFGGCTAGSGADTIQFDGGVFATAQTIPINIGNLSITTNITINGTGANLLTIQNTQAPANNSRAFNVLSGGSLNLSGATITGGNVNGGFGGGGIVVDVGTLVITNVHITGNVVDGYGGGLLFSFPNSFGTINNSTISNNTANGTALGGGGGGIDSDGVISITNSTISGNIKNGSANNGGGVFNFSGNATVTNSTITDNQAVGTGSAGGFFTNGGTVTVRNSIIAANRNNTTTPDVARAYTSTGFNLIGNLGTATGFTGTADQTGVSNANVNLGVLTDNTGQTPTHSLNAGSFAIDKGSNFGATSDQRGLIRPFDDPAIANATGGNGTDVGAFEVQMTTAASVFISGKVTDENGRGIPRTTLFLMLQTGELKVARTNPFGYFRFTDVEVGQTCIINITSKNYLFSPFVLTIKDNISDLNFTPLAERQRN